MGLGEAIQNAKVMDSAVAELTAIAGQKPVVTKARKAIANFKLRENMAIGCMVTLRGARMYEFLDRLMNLALPRVRDFRGVSDRRLRRARQLLARRARADHLSRDRPRQDRQGAGPDGVDRHHRARPTPKARRCCKALGMPFRA